MNWFNELYHSWLDVLVFPFRIVKRAWLWFIGMGTRRAAFFVLSAVVMTVVVMTAFVKVTSQPQFCTSCHIMVPYFDAWEISHHSDVECITCHIEPGLMGTIEGKFVAASMLVNYATGLYKRSKPWAEISDASCLQSGCHDTRLLQSVEEFKGVRFDHQPHLNQPRRDRELRCTSCHANIVQGSHISVTSSTCFLCHLKPDTTGQLTELSECTKCHAPPQGEAAVATFDHADVLTRGVECASCHASDISGDGFVPPVRCNTCHAEVDHIERYSDRDFIHQKHVTERKVDCDVCHIPIRHGKEARDLAIQNLNCGECHGGEENAIELVWNGNLPGLPPTPPVMQRVGMTCNSCHLEPIHRKDGTFAAPDCERCHDKGYDRLWRQWQEPIESSLAKMERALKNLTGQERDTLKRAIRIYREGNPIHNPDLLMVLGERILGEQTNAHSAECRACHPSPSDIAPTWNGRVVSHTKHLEQGLSCRKCHDADGKPHGKLELTKSECSSCHHGPFGQKFGECASCHQAQANTFAGRVNGYDEEVPALMYEAELSCTDCHSVEGNHVSRDVSTTCVECHDEDYATILVEWQQFGDSLLATCETEMKKTRPGSDIYRKYSDLSIALRKDGSLTIHNPELFNEWKARLSSSQ